MRQLNRITINAGPGNDSTWDSRTDEYDILSQEYSDAMLGYDRLYNSETGHPPLAGRFSTTIPDI